MTELLERRYVSQYAEDVLGIMVYRAGVLADADANDVQVTYRVEDGGTVFTRQADHPSLGTYSVSLSAADTGTPGLYEVEFNYAVDAIADTYVLHVQVGPSAPAYDALSAEAKTIVEAVWDKFADLYDSPGGGPHLQVYLQTHFGRNRLAQLLRTSIGKLNTFAQPHMTYSLDPGAQPFPFSTWGPLVEQGLYIEVVKHLIRSYTEQPEVVLGTSVSRLDRRDYQQRWMSILQMEEPDYRETLSHFKLAHMGLGKVSVLVSGGAFGNLGPTAMPGGPGAAAARGMYYARRYF